jgi:acyl-CoA synthetase (NDP forming)
VRFGARLRGVLVQPMAAAGPELLVGLTGAAWCGPRLTLGLGGTFTDLVDDRA